jgi:hypothetical protein
MKQFILFSIFAVGTCVVSQATPCVVGTFSSYEALGVTGCTIGNVTFSHFDLLLATVVNANNIGAGQITVTPTDGLYGPTLDFGANWGASGLASSYTATLLFRVSSTAPIYLTSNTLTTDVARTGLSGIATVAEVNCLGGLLNGAGVLCLGGGITANGTAIASLLNTNLSASITPFTTPVNLIDVVKSITLTAAIGSTASIHHITQGFTAQDTSIPEPSTLVLISSAAILGGCFRRFRKG